MRLSELLRGPMEGQGVTTSGDATGGSTGIGQEWLGSLARVNGSRTEAGGHVLIKNARHTDTLVRGDACKITEPPHEP